MSARVNKDRLSEEVKARPAGTKSGDDAVVSKKSTVAYKNREKMPGFLSGLQKYCVEYNNQFKSVEEMRQEVENTVAAYDEHLKERKDEFKRTKEEAVDEEGWTKVTKGHKRAFRGRKSGISNKSVVISKKKNKNAK